MRVLSKAEFLHIMPTATKRVDTFLPPLTAAMQEYGIVTGARMAMFLAQLAHESGEFRYMEELASGEAYDTGRLASALGNTPEADGDGQRYKGRGPIQITGYDNYKECGKALGLNLLATPELLLQPVHGCRAAGWFWSIHKGLNALADHNNYDAFRKVTKKINGGYNHFESRLTYWHRAKGALNVAT